uniref:Podocin (inferred by orthology to a human protein) n=1 Tax=Anisakis simplex TaxID=6269 RepID=A0A0M3JKL4_ANISI
LCGCILTVLSYIVIILTLPFSLFFCIEMVQEYERAVIFRLGRILSGGARGPGKYCLEFPYVSYRAPLGEPIKLDC